MPQDRRHTEVPGLAQRAVVHQLLRDDRRQRWSPKQLERALRDMTPEAIIVAVVPLETNGVVYRLDEFIGASRCARHLDSLGLISI
jgi:hypothetical protein